MLKTIFSSSVVIGVTIFLLIIYSQTGTVTPNSHNALAPVNEYLKSLVHGAIFPAIFGYWTVAFLINKC
ncbi:hypothetical protein ACD661_15725 [Legionella lytica]|uniref:Uncharacterized protein n=1 Tax=Legionella lytica TaxID=96232 RepID=A0ABW8DBD2_9GAMM